MHVQKRQCERRLPVPSIVQTFNQALVYNKYLVIHLCIFVVAILSCYSLLHFHPSIFWCYYNGVSWISKAVNGGLISLVKT